MNEQVDATSLGRRVGRWTAQVFLLSVPALVLLVVVFEIVARLFLPVSDVPDVLFSPVLGNHFVGNQQGVYVKGLRQEIRARYHINRDGWNAQRDCMPAGSFPGETIAIIGDSFVEALQVDADASLAALLERRLNSPAPGARAVQVCPFGHSGANLFQYVKVLEYVVRRYRPDKVILAVVPNDYAESLEGYARKDNWSLHVVGDRFDVVAPQRAGSLPMRRALRHLATVRYLTVNLDLVTRLYIVRRLFYGDTRRLVAHVDAEDLAVLDDAAFRQRLVREILTRALNVAQPAGATVGLMLETDHAPIYADRPAADSAVRRLTATTLAIAADLGMPTLDLETVFRPAWARDHRALEWPNDGHWNGYAHALIAEAAQRWLATWKTEVAGPVES